MDTSKDYYESVMRSFKTYGRGRTLDAYCRDEGIVTPAPDGSRDKNNQDKLR